MSSSRALIYNYVSKRQETMPFHVVTTSQRRRNYHYVVLKGKFPLHRHKLNLSKCYLS